VILFFRIDRVYQEIHRRLMPAELIRFHEAGHAVVAWFHPSIDPVTEVVVTPYGGSVSYDRAPFLLMTPAELIANATAGLAGMAVERRLYGRFSIGCINDLLICERLAGLLRERNGIPEDAALDELFRRAERIVASRWREIALVAEELRLDGRLDTADLERLLGPRTEEN
jgi:hypothetical protein